MADDFHIKEDDQLPLLRVTLLDASGNVIDLSEAEHVRFIMRNRSTGEVKVDDVATILDAPGGVVTYDWKPTDTETAGHYDAEFEVEHGDGRLETYPNSTYLRIRILPDLGGVR